MGFAFVTVATMFSRVEYRQQQAPVQKLSSPRRYSRGFKNIVILAEFTTGSRPDDSAFW